MATWNEALVAFDRRAELLEGVRDEYIAFLKELFEAFEGATRAAHGDVHEHWFDSKDAPGIMSRWRPTVGSPLLVSSWATAPYGGAAGELGVGLCVGQVDMGKVRSKEEKAARQRRFVDAFLGAAASLPGAPIDQAAPPDDVDTKGMLRLARIPIEGASAGMVIEYLRVAKELDRRVRSCLWLEEALAALPREALPKAAPKGAKWQDEALGGWAGGRYVEIDAESVDGKHCVWVAGLPPGSLVIGHWRKAVHSELCKRLGAKPVSISPDEPNVAEAELLDEATVLSLFAKNDAKKVQSVAREAFATYFELVKR
jgi:hypothetical protein